MDSLITFIVRGVLSPFNPPILTSMTGIGLGLAIESNKTYIKFVAPALGLLLAILAHSVWNLWALLPLGWIVVLLFLEVPLAAGVLAVVVISRAGRGVSYATISRRSWKPVSCPTRSMSLCARFVDAWRFPSRR